MAQEIPGIERVRERFLTLLYDRQIAIAGHAITAWDGETLEEVNDNLTAAQSILHQIAGTAGSLGFAPLGQEARDCENAIIAHLASDAGQLAICPPALVHDMDGFVRSCEKLFKGLEHADAADDDLADDFADKSDDVEEIDVQELRTALI